MLRNMLLENASLSLWPFHEKLSGSAAQPPLNDLPKLFKVVLIGEMRNLFRVLMLWEWRTYLAYLLRPRSFFPIYRLNFKLPEW